MVVVDNWSGLVALKLLLLLLLSIDTFQRRSLLLLLLIRLELISWVVVVNTESLVSLSFSLTFLLINCIYVKRRRRNVHQQRTLLINAGTWEGKANLLIYLLELILEVVFVGSLGLLFGAGQSRVVIISPFASFQLFGVIYPQVPGGGGD